MVPEDFSMVQYLQGLDIPFTDSLSTFRKSIRPWLGLVGQFTSGLGVLPIHLSLST